MTTKSAYIHIPFCRRKCRYCTFISFEKPDLKDEYINALKKDILKNYKGEILSTIYFGGGTPSLISTKKLDEILELLNFNKNTEITIELNPENLNADFLSDLKKIGFNRLSFGVQTFNEEILAQIGRKHLNKDVFDVVENAHKIGFDNISIDLIYGLPRQSLKDFENDLKTALTLDIQHISLYGLKIEEGCYFYNHLPENLPTDDMQADMYLKAIEILNANGFRQYEISNFSKGNCNSKHNLNYWKNEEYYGFGCAAHGYVDGIRYENLTNLEEYIQNPFSKKNEHLQNEKEKLEETIFLGFRTKKGINIKKIEKTFQINFEDKYGKIISKYISSGHIEKNEEGYTLTKEGFLLSTIILSEFI